MNEIKEKLIGEAEESDENGYVDSVWFDEEENVACEIECHLVLEDTYLNPDRYSNNDEFELVTRLALKHGTVLQGEENDYLNNSLYCI